MSSVKFDGNIIETVTALYKRSEKPKARVYRDTVRPGLVISVGPRGATWKISTNSLNRAIGNFTLFKQDDLPAIREMVSKALIEHKAGRPIDTLIERFVAKKDVDLAEAHQKVANGQGFLWEEARDMFIEFAMKELADDTAMGYKSALGASERSSYLTEFEPIAGKPVNKIDFIDLNSVIQNMKARGEAAKEAGKKSDGRRQTNLTVYALKSAFRYFSQNPTLFFMSSNPSRQLETIKAVGKKNKKDKTYNEQTSAKKNRAMTADEIGAFVYGLQFIELPEARNSLYLQLLTGQRLLDTCSALADAFVENPSYGLVWRLEDKTRSWRALPMGPEAEALVRSSREEFAHYGSMFLFPKTKKRRADDPVEGHIHKRTVSGEMFAMRAEGSPLHGSTIDPATHDLRKAFTSVMAPRMSKFTDENGSKLKNDDTVIITHKNEGRDVTASAVYDKNEYLDTKYAILCEWENYVMECYTNYVNNLESPHLIAAE
ncbi:hypothetical protein [Agrobacterium tumefaciens]|uniref:hypothetical protein n=1 Tax=Agrobacterium tumefaciens TaxID=358 RepID=UPI000A43AB26|nr:hypothetical protein [Agrobacterium tumefaciens]